mmetsp:Transcript_2119/g.4271  ORF Transcript_2119/g.4271 Transcript_2119/m.4271 type:complete len:166 (-) Transcript_2119:131-628(-)
MVVMDLTLPAENASALIRRVRHSIPISTPLWICPLKGSKIRQPLATHGHHSGLMMNIGVYGRVCDSEGRRYSKELEEFTAAHGGRKMLYSQNFYTENEFWGRAGHPWDQGAMFDEGGYHRLRQRLGADKVLPDLFSKVCEAGRAPPPQQQKLIKRLGDAVARLML